MTEDMKRMVIAISNWSGDNMSWLQGNSCTGGCNTNTVISTFSNIEVHTANGGGNKLPDYATLSFVYSASISAIFALISLAF